MFLLSLEFALKDSLIPSSDLFMVELNIILSKSVDSSEIKW